MITILHAPPKINLKAAVFDFDGTISTLRCGWETVMLPLMCEYIGGNPVARVRDYIDASTGIQTILQMKWLTQEVRMSGNPLHAPLDPWYFKAEYNRRLLDKIAARRADALSGNRQLYLMDGSESFLSRLQQSGCVLYAASGTDEADVIAEATALGVNGYFTRISGAKPMSESCSKEATLRELITESGFSPENILVVGDGPVEIRLGREYSTLTLGVAGDESLRHGFSYRKQERLSAAHAIVDCFSDIDAIFDWIRE